MSRRLFRNGKIAGEDSREPSDADVLVENGKIIRVASGISSENIDEEFDCSGCILVPAMFDLHVHGREPGEEHKETIQSASEAAINGGITGMVLMPNTSPPIDSGGLVQTVLDIAEDNSRIPVFQAGCITKGRAGEELAGIAGMASRGVPLLSDNGAPIHCPQLMRRAMEYAMDFDIPIASHCEINALSKNGAMNEGPVSYRLGLPGMPSISEEICIDRDIRIAEYTGGRLHVQHVSTAKGMKTIRRAKDDGIQVSCEVTPHHLIFNESDIGEYDTNFKMNPPLRTEEDNEALIQALVDGVCDVIATDHAPHSEFEKNTDFASAPFGITGLETALVSIYHHFIRTGKFGWDTLIKRFSSGPRRLINLDPVPIAEERRAEFLVFNLNDTTVFSLESMRSLSQNTPLIGRELHGNIRQVVTGDQILVHR